MTEPLKPDNIKLNEEFPWPNKWPKDLDESIKFWEDFTPHIDIYELRPPPDQEGLEILNGLGDIPKPLKYFFKT